MSYCRWSSDDFQCDVYCYADTLGGYATHVAANRAIPAEPLPPKVPFDPQHMDAWLARHEKVMGMIAKAERHPIGLPHDGESFNDPSPDLAADRLMELREAGYRVPQYAIDALRQEAMEDIPPLPLVPRTAQPPRLSLQPPRKTYGPPTKGRGGKIRRW